MCSLRKVATSISWFHVKFSIALFKIKLFLSCYKINAIDVTYSVSKIADQSHVVSTILFKIKHNSFSIF